MTRSAPFAPNQLSDAISGFQGSACEPLDVSPWVAMSAMQKAIRRGEKNLALRAAATLLQISPERLWRRIGCIAAEDIGVADLQTLHLATSALAGKHVRATFGGEWQVASYLISRMTAAPKCRGADDLLMCAELHPDLAEARRALGRMSTQELLALMIGDTPLPVRALTCWYVLGTDRRPSPHLGYRRGEPEKVFGALTKAGYPSDLVWTAQENFRRTREVLALFVVLLWPLWQASAHSPMDDELPPQILIGDAPGWSFDTFTREGRHAFKQFLETDCPSARWVNANVPASERVNLLGNVVFRIEGQITRRRSRWPLADQLRTMVDTGSHGSACPDATQLLELVRHDLPALNEVRAQTIGGLFHV